MTTFDKQFEKAMSAAGDSPSGTPSTGVESSNSYYSMEPEGSGHYLITACDPHAKQVLFGWGSDGRGNMWRYGQSSAIRRAVRGHRSRNHDYGPWQWSADKSKADSLIRDIKSNPSKRGEKTAAAEHELLKLLGKISAGTASSHAAKKAAPAAKASTAHDSEILEGMAKMAWAMEWANEEERKAEAGEESENFSGVDIYDAAPKPPKSAHDWAKKIGAQIVRDNKATLTQLYQKVKEIGFPNDAESFGGDLAHAAVGSGVDWTDRVRGRPDFEIKVPRSEYYQ